MADSIANMGKFICFYFGAHWVLPNWLFTTNLAKKLLYEQAILTIPGSMFFPREKNSFIKEKQSIRIAFANSTEREIKSVLERLSKFVL